MTALAARHAAIVDVTTGFADGPLVQARVAELDRICAELDRTSQGHQPAPERCVLLRAARRGHPRTVTEALVRELGWTPERIRSSPSVLMGSTETMAGQLREYRDRFGISYVIVPESDRAALTPVVAQLTGT